MNKLIIETGIHCKFRIHENKIKKQHSKYKLKKERKIQELKTIWRQRTVKCRIT